jgi:cell wall-associated NlpC family hydrolase
VRPHRPAQGGGLAVLVVVTVLASLAAPHATALRGLVADALPVIATPEAPGARPAPGSRAARAVAVALRQRGKPYRWGAEGPGAFDCSGLTWAAWRAAGDLLVYASRGPSRRHVAMVIGGGQMVEARGRGIPVRSTSIRPGWLGAVRPGAGR